MMETKEGQTVARQAATPSEAKGGASSDAAAPEKNGKPGRRADEITLRVPNPLLVHQKKPDLAKEAPLLQVDPASPHSSPTAKLKVSSLVWDEYNSMPLTPAPVAASEAAMLADASGGAQPVKRQRGLMIFLVVAIISAGALAGAFVPRGKSGSQVESQPVSAPKGPVPGAPEKSAELPKTPALAAVPAPAPAARAKRHVSITVEPAEATLALDGAIQNGPAIALDLAPDGKPHMVQATAQGYLPFKKNFTLEGDVNLHISLKRAASPVFVSRPKARPAEPVVKPPVVKPLVAKPLESEPSVKPRVEPVEDFGMDLPRPAVKRQTKKMDEKDPYSP
jgi:hypothetical protein